MSAYRYLASLDSEVQIPKDGTLSRTLHQEGALKVVLFAFDAGQELSEHTASRPAILEIVSGSADLTLGGDVHRAGPGAWAWMPAHLPHAVKALEPTVMLLILLPTPAYA